MSAPVIERCWFRAKDGTYFRNRPLIMDERKEWLEAFKRTLPLRFRRLRKIDAALHELRREWWQAWNEGPLRKERLEPGEREVPMATFREAYPDKPGLWVLDDLRV